MIQEFEAVRHWAAIRGVNGATTDVQYQRFLQEAVEIHDAITKQDEEEFQDAIGDTIVTLINLAVTGGYSAEDCLQKAFEVIEKRKGLTTHNGDFIRYGKLGETEQAICDKLQGNPGSEYWEFEPILSDFKRG